MLPADSLKLAPDVHARSYRLLKWVAEAVRKGFIPATRAHEYADVAESTEDWIRQHQFNLPADCRPENDHIPVFSRFFATYVTTSFEIVDQPGRQLVSSCGCYCPLCSYLVAAPHLKTKRLTPQDKRRGRRLMTDRIEQLAIEHAIPITVEQAEQIAADEATRCAAGYSAYGHWLIKRLDGLTDGPAVLALWREIAWTRTGSPIPSFTLRQSDFVTAEELLVRVISAD